MFRDARDLKRQKTVVIIQCYNSLLKLSAAISGVSCCALASSCSVPMFFVAACGVTMHEGGSWVSAIIYMQPKTPSFLPALPGVSECSGRQAATAEASPGSRVRNSHVLGLT